MENSRALKDFAQMAHAILFSFCGDVLTAMELATSFFPSPTPTLASLTALVASYGAAINAAASGDKTKIVTRNLLRQQVVAKFKELCDSVNTTAQGREDYVTASGFHKNKQREPTHLSIPAPPVIKAGPESGVLHSLNKRMKGGKSCQHMITEGELTDASVWTTVATSSFKHIFKGLKPRTKYWVKLVVIGSREQVKESEPVFMYTI